MEWLSEARSGWSQGRRHTSLGLESAWALPVEQLVSAPITSGQRDRLERAPDLQPPTGYRVPRHAHFCLHLCARAACAAASDTPLKVVVGPLLPWAVPEPPPGASASWQRHHQVAPPAATSAGRWAAMIGGATGCSAAVGAYGTDAGAGGTLLPGSAHRHLSAVRQPDGRPRSSSRVCGGCAWGMWQAGGSMATWRALPHTRVLADSRILACNMFDRR